ncbi:MULTISPECIES: amidase [unclassified Bradyrhizobium]|uniref:amidase n=1 Tax=unclassified Bradyrhizobium TaxID=2631580 RepID=UPI001FF85691|nr:MULTISPECIES: amidase [unclassified Bradyrhizobium]MCK1713419.1 amidase [Bradyrhizobium sp. 143]MCK1730464.1 amidase [Bradyrhizobium sp. 142]
MEHQDRPLWSLNVGQLSAAYVNGLSPRRVIDATLARVRDINPKLNAIVTLDEAGAVSAADASARRWKDKRPLGRLDGVPVTIKDNILVAGLRATWGSRLYENFVPDEDELPVRRLREAGAVILGKTNVPEFTVHGFTHNAVFGTTGNPWDPALTPGGSSGGAVAAVASGMGALAFGTDGGGSIRRPAAHTGLFGFKPSRDMVRRGRGFPAILHDFEVIGPIARCVDDIVSGMEVVAGPAWQRLLGESVAGSPRIAYAPSFGGAAVDPIIRDTVDRTVAGMRSFGLDVELISPFDLAEPLGQVWPVISQTGVAWLLSQHRDWENRVAPAIADMAVAGQKYSARDYLNALDTIASIRRVFETLFERYDFLITPSAAAMPWPAAQSHPTTIDGQPVGPRGHAVFTPVANALGLPAISLPCVVEDASLPVGLQMIAGKDRDWPLLAFAREYEGRLFVHRCPPRWDDRTYRPAQCTKRRSISKNSRFSE